MHATESLARRPSTRLPQPVVIGHRGAPAYRPEHTAASYELAIHLGARMIEPDIVVTRDGVLIARHESELSRSTDVASRPEFAARRTTRLSDDKVCTGWFAEDFTYAELRTLRAVERLPQLRPLNSAYDGRYGILTLAEVVELARARSTDERPIRVLAELKNPGSPAAQTRMAELVTSELRRLGADSASGTVVLQSFEPGLLRDLRARLGEGGPQMVQLVRKSAVGDPMVTPAGLREISTYAQAVGPSWNRVLLDARGLPVSGRSDLVVEAHRAALEVFCWTLRAENTYLPEHLRRGAEPAAFGDALGQAKQLLRLGVAGLITDHPDIACRAVREMSAALV